MKHLFRFFIILTVTGLLGIAGCAAPVGNIGGSNQDLVFWVVPKRHIYVDGDNFDTNFDLSMFTLSRGIVSQIPLKDVEITIHDLESNPVVIKEPYKLTYEEFGEGTKIVFVSYIKDNPGKNRDSYTIELYNILEKKPPGPGDTGISIGWWDGYPLYF